MAEKVTVKAVKRDTRGKNENRRLRVQGKIPVVVYGGGTESFGATAELKELAAVLRSDAGVNSVFYESPNTAHEWLSWRRSLREFAPLLFKD